MTTVDGKLDTLKQAIYWLEQTTKELDRDAFGDAIVQKALQRLELEFDALAAATLKAPS